MDIDYLKKNKLIIFECISGSRAYGLATKQSDTDIKGVFILPEEQFYGFSTVDQILDEKGDQVYYEIKKFLSLAAKNNPNILEMLYAPNDMILHEDAIFQSVKAYHFLSKLCFNTFVNYAMGQIQKARGLNKKIVNPMPKERLNVLDFCYMAHKNGSQALREWLKSRGLDQSSCGLSKLNHFPNVYLLFHNPDIKLRGIVGDKDASDIRLSSIPKDLPPLGYLCFNQEAFKSHCRQHRDYWEWVNKRNDIRYQTNIAHGKSYDSKNMMHVFRLLGIAKEIAVEGTINLKNKEKEFLLQIKSGSYEYEQLIDLAEDKTQELEELFRNSPLPDTPNTTEIEKLLIQCRQGFYH